MKIAVATGTFGHRSLVAKLLSSLEELASVCTHLKIQHGRDHSLLAAGLAASPPATISLELVEYYSSVDAFIQGADVVITHAGTGTVIDLLKRGCSIIVVPNPALKDNHQQEFASLLAQHHVTVSDLSTVISDVINRNFTRTQLKVSGEIWRAILPLSQPSTSDASLSSPAAAPLQHTPPPDENICLRDISITCRIKKGRGTR